MRVHPGWILPVLLGCPAGPGMQSSGEQTAGSSSGGEEGGATEATPVTSGGPGDATLTTSGDATSGLNGASSGEGTTSGGTTGGQTTGGAEASTTSAAEASTTDVGTGERGEDESTGCVGECCVDECFHGLGAAELLDPAPAYDIDRVFAVGFVVGNDDGVRLWGVGDGWEALSFAATPGPVRALVSGYLEVSEGTRGVAALIPAAGEMRVYAVEDGQLVLVDTLEIPAGAVDVDTAWIDDDGRGDLVVLDGALARLHRIKNMQGSFAELPPVELVGQPTVVSGRVGLGSGTLVAAVAEPGSSSVLLVEAGDEVAADLDVVAVPEGPTDLVLSQFSDVGDPSVLVLAETASRTAMVTRQDAQWKVGTGDLLDRPSRIAIGGLYEPFGVAAVLHRPLGEVSVGPFSFGEYAGIHAPLTSVPTLPGAEQLIVMGYADVIVVSPTDGLAIHDAF